ncbi:potassium channel family protein [Ruminococcus gauvreauii]|uniref:TrkA family potassium uptake protein n=1 Tax=Ruminococcus gauvreauii TaxID=438033 RepID=A0ABY5VL25_9FIRM|nr:TrkA family potassium uptake protein [Ruminococcus gauvreauii]UWP61275.1 TrkA family potassium uptake protein [Ruminococcus gauvreauii]
MGKKQYAVLGLGKFGWSVAMTLAQSGCEVLAVDKNREIVEAIADEVTCAVHADMTNPKAVHSLGLESIDVAVIALAEDMETSIMGTILVKEANVPYVLAKAVSALHATILKKIGADEVVFPEQDSGVRLARNLVSGGFEDLFSLSDAFSMVELKMPAQWTGKTLRELDLRGRYHINVAAIKEGEDVRVSLHPDEQLDSNATMVLIGNNIDLERMKGKLK